MVSTNEKVTTVELAGEEVSLWFEPSHPFIFIINRGDDDIYASLRPGITPEADGVYTIPKGGFQRITADRSTVYIYGTGKAEVQASEIAHPPIKIQRGGDGSSYVLPTMSKTVKGGAKIDGKTLSVSGDVLSANYSNENLLLNPNFQVSQRGTQNFDIPYNGFKNDVGSIKNWYITSYQGEAHGTLTVDDNGLCFQVSSAPEVCWFGQDLEAKKFLGKTFTLSFEVAARANTDISFFSIGGGYNNSGWNIGILYSEPIDSVGVKTLTFSIPENWEYPNLKVGLWRFSDITIKWVKLELGDKATEFIPPNPIWESIKCQNRYGVFYGESHNSIWRNSNITADYDSGAFSEHVADGSFDDIYMGDYIEKTVRINGTDYNIRGYVVHCDPFFGGHNDHAIVNTHHTGLFIVGLPNHNMNGENTTAGGYAGSGMHSWLTDTVLPALEATFGAEHLVAHQKSLSNSVDVNAANRSGGKTTGASNNYGWATNCKISLLTETQVRGTTVWSSSAYDTGEACNQLGAFRLVNPQRFTGDKWWWLRDVISNISFAGCNASGGAGYGNASNENMACPLVLLK